MSFPSEGLSRTREPAMLLEPGEPFLGLCCSKFSQYIFPEVSPLILQRGPEPPLIAILMKVWSKD